MAAILEHFGFAGPAQCVNQRAHLPALTGAWRHQGGGIQLSASGHFRHLDRRSLYRPDLLAGRTPRTLNMNRLGDYQEYLNFLYSTLETQNKNKRVLTENTALVADIGLSSLEVMEFIEKIEDHFDISIPLNILPDVNTIGDLAKKVRELNL